MCVSESCLEHVKVACMNMFVLGDAALKGLGVYFSFVGWHVLDFMLHLLVAQFSLKIVIYFWQNFEF